MSTITVSLPDEDLAFLLAWSRDHGTSPEAILAKQARYLREELEKPSHPDVVPATDIIPAKFQGSTSIKKITEEEEELVQKCIEIMRQERKASTSLFQRRLRLGYSRASRMLDILEQRRYIAPGEGARPREILVDLS